MNEAWRYLNIVKYDNGTWDSYPSPEKSEKSSYKSRNAGTLHCEWQMIDYAKKSRWTVVNHLVETWCLFAAGETPEELETELKELPFYMWMAEKKYKDGEGGSFHQELYEGAQKKKLLKALYAMEGIKS